MSHKYLQSELNFYSNILLHLCRWQFATESADIGFGVFMKAKKGEWKKAAQMQEVVPSQRYNAHLVPEDGSLTCERPGVCEYPDLSQSLWYVIIQQNVHLWILCLFS